MLSGDLPVPQEAWWVLNLKISRKFWQLMTFQQLEVARLGTSFHFFHALLGLSELHPAFRYILLKLKGYTEEQVPIATGTLIAAYTTAQKGLQRSVVRLRGYLSCASWLAAGGSVPVSFSLHYLGADEATKAAVERATAKLQKWFSTP